MIERLAEDHENARRLATAMAGMPGIRSAGDIAQPGDGPLDPARVVTNFVFFRVDRDRGAFADACAARGLLLDLFPHDQLRAATHYGIGAAEIDRTIGIMAAVLAEAGGGRNIPSSSAGTAARP